MIHISGAQEFQKLKSLSESNAQGLVVHFSANWCEPCASLRALLESKVNIYKDKAIFADVDCDAHLDICAAEDIDKVPAVVFYRKSSSAPLEVAAPVAEVYGAKLEIVEQNLESLFGSKMADYNTLEDYLNFLVKRPGIVAFITGSPSRPRCGFTEKLCQLLDEVKAKYLYYDVMGNEEVCEGLKAFSEWPTYPQVYVDGELIGGWDICKELMENGALEASLKLK